MKLTFAMIVMALSVIIGYILLAMVYEGPLWVKIVIGIIVAAVSIGLIIWSVRLGKAIDHKD